MEPKEHNGHTITLTDEWRFSIAGPLAGGERSQTVFSSLTDAQAAIDDRVTQHERQTRVRLSIPVLLANGAPGTVTGAHGGHFKALGLGDADECWPPHPHLQALLRERADLDKRRNAIAVTLNKYRIRTAAEFGVRTHDHAIASLREKIAKAAQQAADELPGSPNAERLSA